MASRQGLSGAPADECLDGCCAASDRAFARVDRLRPLRCRWPRPLPGLTRCVGRAGRRPAGGGAGVPGCAGSGSLGLRGVRGCSGLRGVLGVSGCRRRVVGLRGVLGVSGLQACGAARDAGRSGRFGVAQRRGSQRFAGRGSRVCRRAGLFGIARGPGSPGCGGPVSGLRGVRGCSGLRASGTSGLREPAVSGLRGARGSLDWAPLAPPVVIRGFNSGGAA